MRNADALIYALGYGLVDGDTFRNAPGQLRISCYLGLRDEAHHEGYVVFLMPKPKIILPDLLESKEAIAVMDSECRFDKLEQSSLHGTINAYAMTLCRGTRIALEGHASEAYLHLIIALEQLFSSSRQYITDDRRKNCGSRSQTTRDVISVTASVSS